MILKIVVDTREKHPWDFSRANIPIEISRDKLDTGDYALAGNEKLLCIERKESVTEIANNITQSRFQRELERMAEYKYKFILGEFSVSNILDFPYNAGLPEKIKNKIKVSGSFVMKRMIEYSIRYDIRFIPCGHRAYAEEVALAIMKEINKGEQQ